MERNGPQLEILTHRLTETPPDFLDEPPAEHTGSTMTAALINDLVKKFGSRLQASQLTGFVLKNDAATRNRLALARITTWLLADEWFLSVQLQSEEIMHVFEHAVAELATTSPAKKFVTDPDRREELARVVLARLNYRPANETLAQATDRLSSLSSTERNRLLEASRDAERRARAIREALVKKAAEQSADKWTRE